MTTAINLFTSFGYFEDPAEDLRVAKNLHESLKPGGKLVMEMMGKEVLARHGLSSALRRHGTGVVAATGRLCIGGTVRRVGGCSL